MLKTYCNLCIIILASSILSACHSSDTPTSISSCDSSTQIQVCFSPEQNCTQMLIDAINASQHSIYVQAYSFTSYPIAKALVKAQEKGVQVAVIVDKTDIDPSHFSVLPYLNQHHIPLYVDNQVNIAHNKVMIFDENSLETGSFNYTKAAQSQNAENMLIIHNKAIAEVYFNNWQQRLKASQKL